MRLLLERGASVEQTTMRGETPLHLGARSCSLEVAELLLTHGAAVDAKAKVCFFVQSSLKSGSRPLLKMFSFSISELECMGVVVKSNLFMLCD